MATAATGSRTTYRVRLNHVEACNCQHGCNCQFGGFPNEGACEFIIAYEVTNGQYGDVDLGGVRAVVAATYPAAIHEGNGHVVLFLDEHASDDQANAFATILRGEAGGMPWEALAGTVSRFEGPVRVPIELKVNGRESRVRIPAALEMRQTPLRNPVTGNVNDVHITYPQGGFFWNDAEIATTEVMEVRYGDLSFSHAGRFASTAQAEWTNEGTPA